MTEPTMEQACEEHKPERQARQWWLAVDASCPLVCAHCVKPANWLVFTYPEEETT